MRPLGYLLVKTAATFAMQGWCWRRGEFVVVAALQIQQTSLTAQILFYMWANRIVIGEPLLPYERQSLQHQKENYSFLGGGSSSRRAVPESSPDLE